MLHFQVHMQAYAATDITAEYFLNFNSPLSSYNFATQEEICCMYQYLKMSCRENLRKSPTTKGIIHNQT